MTSIRAVIFDRDGTLVYFDEGAIDHLMQRIATIAPQIPPAILDSHWDHWAGPWPRTPDEEPQFWRLFWQPLATQYHLDHQQTADLCTLSATYYTCFRPFPETLACLRALHTARIKLAILTNFELASVAHPLAYCGIDLALFSGLFSSSTIGFHKPDPRAFRAVTDTFQIAPEEWGYVDDHIDHVLAARALGMQAFWLDRTRSTPDLDAGVLHALTPLIQLCIPPFVRSTTP